MKTYLVLICLAVAFSAQSMASTKKSMKIYNQWFDSISKGLSLDGYALPYEQIKNQISPVYKKDLSNPKTKKLLKYLKKNKRIVKTKHPEDELAVLNIFCNLNFSYALQIFSSELKFDISDFELMEFKRKLAQECLISNLESATRETPQMALTSIGNIGNAMGMNAGNLVKAELEKKGVYFSDMSYEQRVASGKIMTRLIDVLTLVLAEIKK